MIRHLSLQQKNDKMEGVCNAGLGVLFDWFNEPKLASLALHVTEVLNFKK